MLLYLIYNSEFSVREPISSVISRQHVRLESISNTRSTVGRHARCSDTTGSSSNLAICPSEDSPIAALFLVVVFTNIAWTN